MAKINHSIFIVSENKPGVLYRISNLFLRKKINIESINVVDHEKKGFSKFEIGVNTDLDLLKKISPQIQNIIEVTNVEIIANNAWEKSNGKISSLASSMDVSPIKKTQLLADSYEGVISLAQGIPSFNTAEYIKLAAKNAMDLNLSDKYTQGYGIKELREAAALKITKENKIKTTPSQIIITHGGIEALMSIFMAVLNTQDEIVVLTPDYASHLTQISIALQGKKAVFAPLRETKSAWCLDVDILESKITQKTKAILLTNPSNPIGKVYTFEELKQIARIAVKYDLLIITDEIYEYFVFNNKKHISIGSFPEVGDRVISVFGVSKSYCMTGWRIGYITAEKNIIDNIFKIHDCLITCPTAISQYAALAAINGTKKYVLEYKKAFEKRRQITMDELSKSKLIEFTIPEGAYYIFPKIIKQVDDTTLAAKLIKEAKVAVVPGSGFGSGGEGHFRISFGSEEKILKEGLRRLVDYINKNL